MKFKIINLLLLTIISFHLHAKNESCVFGGWVSNQKASGKCQYPWKGLPQSLDERNQYGPMCGTGKFRCNPYFFGKDSSGNGLCVKTKSKYQDATIQCIKKSKKEFKGFWINGKTNEELKEITKDLDFYNKSVNKFCKQKNTQLCRFYKSFFEKFKEQQVQNATQLASEVVSAVKDFNSSYLSYYKDLLCRNVVEIKDETIKSKGLELTVNLNLVNQIVDENKDYGCFTGESEKENDSLKSLYTALAYLKADIRCNGKISYIDILDSKDKTLAKSCQINMGNVLKTEDSLKGVIKIVDIDNNIIVIPWTIPNTMKTSHYDVKAWLTGYKDDSIALDIQWNGLLNHSEVKKLCNNKSEASPQKVKVDQKKYLTQVQKELRENSTEIGEKFNRAENMCNLAISYLRELRDDLDRFPKGAINRGGWCQKVKKLKYSITKSSLSDVKRLCTELNNYTIENLEPFGKQFTDEKGREARNKYNIIIRDFTSNQYHSFIKEVCRPFTEEALYVPIQTDMD